MATAVLSAQDCLAYSPAGEEHAISISRHGRRQRSQFLQTADKSREVSAHFFPNADNFGYTSPRKGQVKGNSLNRNYVLVSSPPDKRRSSKSRVHDDFQPEIVRQKVNSEGRTHLGSNNNDNNNVEGPRKGSMGDGRREAGRSLVMGQVTLLKRGQTVKDVKGISKGANQSAPLADRLGERWGTSRYFSDAMGVSWQALTDGEHYVKPAASDPSCSVLNSEKWAGPAFVNSPSPSCLPFPKFSVKKSVEDIVPVDSSATRDLRRLLGLD